MAVIIVRALILYFVVIFTLRLMGKKQLGELQPSELVTTIMVSNIATVSLENPASSVIAGIVPIIAIACFDVFMSVFTLRRAGVRKIVTGSPRVIICKGKIDKSELLELRYTLDDVFESMRDNGIFNIDEVEYAVVETTGKINFLPKQNAGIGTISVIPPAIVIKDGTVDDGELKRCGFGEGWLEKLLKHENTTAGNVFLLSVKGQENYTII